MHILIGHPANSETNEENSDVQKGFFTGIPSSANEKMPTVKPGAAALLTSAKFFHCVAVLPIFNTPGKGRKRIPG